MKATVTTLCAVFALAGATDAKAYLVAKPKCATMSCRMHSQLTNLKHARYVCSKGAHYSKKWSCTAVKWLKREYNQTMAVLHPAGVAVSSSYPSHEAGWECIHSREGAWDADTGNGYHGGLQMSYGWAGRVGDAAQLSPSEQMAIADAEAREHGYSYGWMASQWPNTFPPCAGYFN